MINKVVQRQAFLDMIIPLAIEQEKLAQIPAEVTVGQAILESGWGQSRLAKEGNNLFGIKAGPDWQGKTLNFQTSEYIGQKAIYVRASFKAYPDYQGSFTDHTQFLQKRRYEKAFLYTNDWKSFLREIWRAGYATDINYVKGVISVLTPGILKGIADARLSSNREAQLPTQSDAPAKPESLYDRITRYCRAYFKRS